jgi:AcrR family transcriptional regulator
VALIEAAESLFATFGVDAVSTRQIGNAIGSSNTNVVAYYFGSKASLVEAVYRHRLPEIDSRRAQLLREAIETGREDDLAVLLHAFALPFFEQTDANGRHSYACFIAAVERAGMIATRGEVDAEFPTSAELVRRICDKLPTGKMSGHFRIRLATALIIASLQAVDVEGPSPGPAARDVFETALQMATAALTGAPAAAQS